MKRSFTKKPKKSIGASSRSVSNNYVKCSTDAVNRLKSLDWDDINYDEIEEIEMTYLANLEHEVLDSMGLWIEPSIQGGQGGVWILTQEDDETVVDDYDYADYVARMIRLALNSENDAEFKERYRSFIESIME